MSPLRRIAGFALPGAAQMFSHSHANVFYTAIVAETDPLVEALKRGEKAALREVYAQHHTTVRRFARRLLGDEAEAEDLVHDVFVALPNAIRGYRGESSLRTFLLSIANNHARHHIRAACRRRALVANATTATTASFAAAPDLSLALVRALDTLTEDHRVAFILCEVEGMTSREVAHVVGATEETVRARVFHARRKLRESFDQGAP